jgi:nicotinamide-nucleotide amidase
VSELPRSSVLLAVGTELTEGVVLNTHFRFLGSELKSLGFPVVRAVQLPDEPALFGAELRAALAAAGVVVITGGLGPTSDDLTREVVAQVTGRKLVFQPQVWETLLGMYAASGRQIPQTNRKQAQIPEGFRILQNVVGTAPGFWGRVGASLCVALPGPPAELEPMFLRLVVPVLEAQAGQAPGEQLGGELPGSVFMVPESLLEEALQQGRQAVVAGPSAPAEGGLSWGTRVAEDRITFTLRGAEAQGREELFAYLQGRFGPLRLRRGDLRPSGLLFELLRQRGETVSFAESCTGGLLAKMLTDMPGSSEVFWGAVVAYANAAKTSLLGVPEATLAEHGAVSPQTASAMSYGLLRCAGTGVGVAVTGIAGPEGGSAEKPVGTVWISARLREGAELCRHFLVPGGRDQVRRRSAVAAFLMAECLLRGQDPAVLG